MGARLEHDVRNWLKATIESPLGQLGAVGAMVVEDIM